MVLLYILLHVVYILLMFYVSLFSSQKALDRYIATWDFTAQRPDELSLSKVRETKETLFLDT